MYKLLLEQQGFDSVLFASAIFEHSNLAIFLVNVHGPRLFTYTGLNPAHERLTGLRSEQIKDKHPHDFLPASVADSIVSHYEECRTQKDVVTYEETIPFQGEDTFWLTQLIPLIETQGDVHQIIGASININSQKTMERNLLKLLEFNQAIIDIAHMGLMIYNKNGHCISVNEAAMHLFGIDNRNEFLSKHFIEILPSYAQQWEAIWEKKIHSPEVYFTNNAGEEKWISLQSVPYHNHDSTYIIVSTSDITALKLQQKELEEKNRLINTLLQYIPNPIAAFQEDGTMSFHNSSFAIEFSHLHPHNQTTTIASVVQDMTGNTSLLYPHEKAHHIIEISLKKNKRIQHYILEQYFMSASEQQNSRIIWSFTNITPQKRLIHKLEKEVHRDFLTGLYNRRGMGDILPTEWKRAIRENTPLSFLMIDIDFFKNYNDSLGHAAGDICLKTTAHILRDACYRPGDFLFRYGGEEFLVLLTNTHAEGALLVSKRIQKILEQYAIPHPTSSIAPIVTASIGIYTIIPSDASWDEAVKKADLALYAAKKQGRNSIYTSS